MIDFNELRALARRKRDAAYLHAKNEYEATLREIHNLEHKLAYDRVTKGRKLIHKVDAVIPIGRDFSVDDILAALEALEPKKAWSRDSISGYVTKLYKNGIIMRVRNSAGKNPATYRRADHPERLPEKKTLMMLVDEVLTKPMTVQEIVVAVLDRGFVTIVTPVDLAWRLTYKLRNGPFVCEGERWSKG